MNAGTFGRSSNSAICSPPLLFIRSSRLISNENIMVSIPVATSCPLNKHVFLSTTLFFHASHKHVLIHSETFLAGSMA